MRMTDRLSRIAILAGLLRHARGDTEWTDDERQAVSDALALLDQIPVQNHA